MVHLNIRAQVGESRRIQGRQATSTRSPRQVFSHGGSAALKTRRWGWFFCGEKNISRHTLEPRRIFEEETFGGGAVEQSPRKFVEHDRLVRSGSTVNCKTFGVFSDSRNCHIR